MAPGVYLIYGAKSNAQHTFQELSCAIFICAKASQMHTTISLQRQSHH